ncbi:hypothetical protein [uncultured Amnibacterium sp.]|uniref:hypothetical protein n=1 Tax=uncultured Amnibacterium sp. TaxID=1631851 RepID=UPI0035CACB37
MLLGANDLQNGTTTYSGLIASLTTMYKMLSGQGITPVGVTILLKTTSMTIWATTTNQTAFGATCTEGSSSVRSHVDT